MKGLFFRIFQSKEVATATNMKAVISYGPPRNNTANVGAIGSAIGMENEFVPK